MLTRLRFVLFTVLMFALTLTATAQRESVPPSAFTLAKHVPPGALLYAAARTDAGFIETLDGLINIFGEAVGTPSGAFITNLLRDANIRPWLGDSVALYILPPTGLNADSSELYGFILETTDSAAAAAYYTDIYGKDPIQVGNGMVAFFEYGTSIFITDSLVIIGEQGTSPIPLGDSPSLADSPRFAKALSAMPAGQDYPAFVYLDPRSLITAAGSELFAELQPVDVPALAESLGVFGFGLTQLDGQTYAFDLGWSKGEGSPFTAFYLPDPNLPIPPALNPDFLNVVPADAQFVLHGAGLWSQLESSTRAAGALSNALRSRLMTAGLMDLSLSNPFIWFNSQWASAFTELSVRGSLDLNSEQLRAALDGESVLAVRLSEIPNERVPRLLIEPGVWFSSRDGGSQALLNGGVALIETFGAQFESQADNFTFPVADALSVNGNGNEIGLSPELIWLATDNLTYIGADALTLENKETFVAVPRVLERIEPIRPHLLDGATGFAWVDFVALKPLTDEADITIQTAVAPFDSLFASLRQTETDVAARLAFRLKP